MAILAVTETTEREHSAVLEKGARKSKRTFWVETDDQTTSLQTIRETTGVPRRGDFHPTDAGSFCQEVQIQPLADDPRTFAVVCNYDSNSSVQQEEQQNENPLLRPAVVELDGEDYTEVAKEDVNGKAYRNSAGDPLDPPPLIERSRGVIVISRNQAVFVPTFALSNEDVINADVFLGFPPRTLRLKPPKARPSWENQVAFWQVTYRLIVNWRTWKGRYLDAGYRMKTSDGMEYIRDDLTGAQVSSPVPLDGSGIRLEPEADPQYLEFDDYREVPFGTLGIL